VRVEPRPERTVRAQLEISPLTSDEPSAFTRWALQLMEAEEQFEKDPRVVLRHLQTITQQQPARAVSYATCELAFLAAQRLGDRDLYLMAAAYAYDTLLAGDRDEPLDPYDRHFRWACDIYNRSVAHAFRVEPGRFQLEGGRRELPVGPLEVTLDTTAFPHADELVELYLADELEVIGLDFRVRDSGLGAPLVAVVARRGDGTAGVGIQDTTSLSATAFLRLDGPVAELGHGTRATLQLISTYDRATVAVGDRRIPLEADLTTTLAFSTERADLWSFDLRGLFKGRDAMRENGLILPRPFESGRIPVVLVHGTASNPSYWAELMNSLAADRDLRGRYQFWLFLYTTGNPIALSSASLRQEIVELVHRYDPEGRDEALRQMVVIGHSQGGLLAKMTGVHLEADAVTRELLGRSFDELELDPEAAALVRELYDVEPVPYVQRIVYVSTPHRGSFLADSWFARLFARMISLPGELVATGNRVLKRISPQKLPPDIQPRIPTSLENMRPNSPFLKLLEKTPVDARIHTHSIISIGDAKEPEGADDGVVAYESAHVEGVDSEVLVPSSHSCQAHPRTIIEIRRILRENIGLETPDIGLNAQPTVGAH